MNWKGVPVELIETWFSIFSGEPVVHDLETLCPICGSSNLHRFYDRRKSIAPREIGGIVFDGSGSLWEWCSNCKTYEHSSVLVPAKWKAPYPVEARNLTAEPENVELARQEAKRLL